MPESFNQSIEKLKEEFIKHLSEILSDDTVRTYKAVMELFIFFLENKTEVSGFEDITRGMVNSGFPKFWKRTTIDSVY